MTMIQRRRVNQEPVRLAMRQEMEVIRKRLQNRTRNYLAHFVKQSEVVKMIVKMNPRNRVAGGNFDVYFESCLPDSKLFRGRNAKQLELQKLRDDVLSLLDRPSLNDLAEAYPSETRNSLLVYIPSESERGLLDLERWEYPFHYLQDLFLSGLGSEIARVIHTFADRPLGENFPRYVEIALFEPSYWEEEIFPATMTFDQHHTIPMTAQNIAFRSLQQTMVGHPLLLPILQRLTRNITDEERFHLQNMRFPLNPE